MHRRIPEPDELVVQLKQRDRAAGHFERRDVVADQPAADVYPEPIEIALELMIYHVQLDQRRTAHSIHQGQHIVTTLERQILDDHLRQHLDDLCSRPALDALPARLAMNADADLHLVVADVEGWPSRGGHRT